MMIKGLIGKIMEKFKYKNESNLENDDKVFIYSSDECVINPKYISTNDYNSLVKFEKFLKNHDNLTKQEIDQFLDCEACAFLNNLNKKMPNFIQDLKNHGAKAVGIMYVSDIIYSRSENEKLVFCVK